MTTSAATSKPYAVFRRVRQRGFVREFHIASFSKLSDAREFLHRLTVAGGPGVVFLQAPKQSGSQHGRAN